jgi:hypothetical protein
MRDRNLAAPSEHVISSGGGALMTLTEVENESKLGHTTIYVELNSGRLRGKKVGRRTLVLRKDYDEWLANLPAFVPLAAGVARDAAVGAGKVSVVKRRLTARTPRRSPARARHAEPAHHQT